MTWSLGNLEVKQFLNKFFLLIDLNKLAYFFGIEVAYIKADIYFSKIKFAPDLIESLGITNDKLVETLEALGIKMKSNDEETLENPMPFHQLVGVLSYFTITWPDMIHAVHVIASVHMRTTMLIIHYVKNSIKN